MKNALLLVLLVACSGGKQKVNLVDATGGAVCDPLAQTGCRNGEKCGWVIDVAATKTAQSIGHIACVPDGDKVEGQTCVLSVPAQNVGHSDCVAGTECVARVCRAICNPVVGAAGPLCDADHACAQYASLFNSADATLAGVCDVRCNPLTQSANVGNPVAGCASPDPAKTIAGCYRARGETKVDYTCAPNGLPGRCSTTTDTTCNYSFNDDVNADGVPDDCPAGETCQLDVPSMRTDRVAARTPGPNTAYINGCAPGFVPFFAEMTGSTTVICAGLCAPLSTDNTRPANVIGDPNAAAKLPLKPAAEVGDGTCVAGKKGSVGLNPAAEQQNCLYMWAFNINMASQLIDNPFNDNLGVCYDFRQYTYDDDNNQMTPRVAVPSCRNLPPKGFAVNCTCDANGRNCAGTGCPDGQAHEWDCYTTAETTGAFAPGANPAAFLRPALKDYRVGDRGDGRGLRHQIIQ